MPKILQLGALVLSRVITFASPQDRLEAASQLQATFRTHDPGDNFVEIGTVIKTNKSNLAKCTVKDVAFNFIPPEREPYQRDKNAGVQKALATSAISVGAAGVGATAAMAAAGPQAAMGLALLTSACRMGGCAIGPYKLMGEPAPPPMTEGAVRDLAVEEATNLINVNNEQQEVEINVMKDALVDCINANTVKIDSLRDDNLLQVYANFVSKIKKDSLTATRQVERTFRLKGQRGSQINDRLTAVTGNCRTNVDSLLIDIKDQKRTNPAFSDAKNTAAVETFPVFVQWFRACKLSTLGHYSLAGLDPDNSLSAQTILDDGKLMAKSFNEYAAYIVTDIQEAPEQFWKFVEGTTKNFEMELLHYQMHEHHRLAYPARDRSRCKTSNIGCCVGQNTDTRKHTCEGVDAERYKRDKICRVCKVESASVTCTDSIDFMSGTDTYNHPYWSTPCNDIGGVVYTGGVNTCFGTPLVTPDGGVQCDTVETARNHRRRSRRSRRSTRRRTRRRR